MRFGSMSPPPFPIPSTESLPIFSDNVIPSMLVHLGVIDLSASPSLNSLFTEASEVEKLLTNPVAAERTSVRRREGPVVNKEQSFILRAAAIDACELIVATAKRLGETAPDRVWMKGMELSELDAWLWQYSKDRDDYRELDRFVDRDTVFF